MVDFFLLDIPDDPAPCRTAAESLRSVARTARSTADFVATQATVPRSDFSGVAARGYRTACTGVQADVRLLASDMGGLADALDAYATRVEDARRLLRQVRRVAIAERLEVGGNEVRLPECPVPAQKTAFHLLVVQKNRAHSALVWARDAWARALERVTGEPVPGRFQFPLHRPDDWPPKEGEYPFPALPPLVGPGPLPIVEPEPPAVAPWRLREERDPVPPDRSTPVDRPADQPVDRPEVRPAPADPVPAPAPGPLAEPAPAAPAPHHEAPTGVGFLFAPEIMGPADATADRSCGFDGVLS